MLSFQKVEKINISVTISQEEGKVDVLANEAGDRITPAVVSITDEETVSLINLKKKLIYTFVIIFFLGCWKCC